MQFRWRRFRVRVTKTVQNYWLKITKKWTSDSFLFFLPQGYPIIVYYINFREQLFVEFEFLLPFLLFNYFSSDTCNKNAVYRTVWTKVDVGFRRKIKVTVNKYVRQSLLIYVFCSLVKISKIKYMKSSLCIYNKFSSILS